MPAARPAGISLVLLFLLIGSHGGRAQVAPDAQTPPAEIRFGLVVTSIHGLDVASGSWGVEFWAWFRHKPGAIDPLRHFEVLGHDQHLEQLDRVVLPDGSIHVLIRGRAVVANDFDLRAYPFDRHTLWLGFALAAPASAARLSPDRAESRIADVVALRGWDVTGLRLTERTHSWDTGLGRQADGKIAFSRAVMEIDIARERSALIIDPLTGFIVALVISAMIFLVRWDQLGVRTGLATSAVFASVGNFFTLNTILGTQTTFGLVEQLTLITLASICIALGISLLTFRVGAKRGPEAAWRIDRAAIIVSQILFVGLALVSVWAAIG